MLWTDRDQDIADAIAYGDLEEAEILRELKRLGIQNDPAPEVCPKCGNELRNGSGFAGELILWCDNPKCDAGIVWEDAEGAIRSVF